MRKFLLTGVAAVGLAVAGSAQAGDVAAGPSFGRSVSSVVAPGGLYIWGDGAWEHVNLPRVAVGLRNVDASLATLRDQGALASLRPQLDGYGLRGAIGYVLPPGAVSPSLGANARVELGGSFGHAAGDASTVSSQTTTNVALLTLNGAGAIAFLCSGGTTCTSASKVSSGYENWRVNANVASDFRAGVVVLTPSAGVFGGTGYNNETLVQSFTQLLAGAPVGTGAYDANTTTRWRDIGARVGMDANVQVTDWLAVGGSGYVSVANRDADFAEHDVGNDSLNLVFTGSSAMLSHATATAFVANAELGLTFTPMAMVSLRTFAGINYDRAVPGFVGPSFGGSVNSPTSRTPASITFREEASYYAGAGALVRF